MYKNYKIAVVIPAYNERNKTAEVVKKIPFDLIDEVVVVNDGSQDDTKKAVEATGRATILHSKTRQGIGFAIRKGLRYAQNKNYQVVVVMAGNGKDNPDEIKKLIEPIINDGVDYVQGSRYLKGGEHGKMPYHRLLFTKLYTWAIRILYGQKVTDGTNGFRAYKLNILDDPGINLNQEWLREPLEYYLSIKVLLLDYKVREVPVTKLYPQKVIYSQYTKVTPFIGWFKRLKPLFLLRLGLKK